MTARFIGSKLTGSKRRLEVSPGFDRVRASPLLSLIMENKHVSPNNTVPAASSAADQGLATPPRTVNQIIAGLAFFTPEQRSLAWSPEPPFASVGASDCRVGGSCGLDFDRETARARWVQARHRWNREQKRLLDAPPSRG